MSHRQSQHSITSDDIVKDAPPPVAPENAHPPAEKPAPKDDSEDLYKPKTIKFWLVILSAVASMFLVALDRTILATAIPRITDDFNSLGDIGWYSSGYMLTTAACQLLFGRIYRFYDLRWTFLICIAIFEIGSAICGSAPSSTVFIVGRAVAGVGAAGISTGSIMTIIPLVPLHKRPMFQSLFGMVFGLASVAGPLVGGAFTERVSWRWCFYMNLPIGAAAFVFLYFFDFPKKPKSELSLARQLMQLDPLGTFFFVPSIVSLLLALQWGGSTYAWSNWRIILLFVCFVIAGIAFAAVQITMPESASLPVRVIKQRTMYAGTFYMMFLSGAMMLCANFIPFWLQTTHDVNPVKSGIYTIPLVLSLVVASIVSGIITQKSGYYSPAMIISPAIAMVGEGLLTTFTPTSGSPHWIGYQFLTGFGIGFGMQTIGLAVQATVQKDDVSTGMAITFFAQQLGGAIFISVGQTILSTGIVSRLAHIPGLDAQQIIKSGATQLHKIVAPQFVPLVKEAYNHVCTRIFLTAVVLSGVQLLVACGIPWKSIKKPSAKPDTEKAEASQA